MIPLVAPTMTAKDRSYMYGAIRSGVLTSEAEVARFEEEFAARVGCAGAVAVCSGTTALTLALSALDIKPADLTMPSLCCSAVFNAALAAVDASFDYLAQSGIVDGAFDIRGARMTQRVAVVKVHAFGNGTTDDLRDLLTASLIEDYTLSLGAVPILWTKLGVCSTHASKMISTGRGGVVFSNDTALLDEVRALAYYDQTPNGTLGAHSLGMSALQAALGVSQLRQLDAFIARRREIAAVYSEAFEAAGIDCPDADCGSVFFRYLIGVDDPAAKVAALAERGIAAGRGVFPPLHRQLGLSDDDFPGATACVNRLLSVPCHPSLTDAQVQFIANALTEVCSP